MAVTVESKGGPCLSYVEMEGWTKLLYVVVMD